MAEQPSPVQRSACVAATRSGHPCQMPALVGGTHCFNHAPARVAERQAARRKGGEAKAAQARATLAAGAPVPLRTTTDVLALLERTAGEVMAMAPSERRARAAISCVLAAVRVLEVGDLAERMRALEEQLRTLTPQPAGFR